MQFEKYWGKQKVELKEFCEKIKQGIEGDYYYLSRPYAKLKFLYQTKALRLVVAIKSDINIIVPIFITDKNDKLWGYNMDRNSIKEKTLSLMDKITSDLAHDDYSEH